MRIVTRRPVRNAPGAGRPERLSRPAPRHAGGGRLGAALHVVPGLEDLARGWLAEHVPAARVVDVRHSEDERDSLLLLAIPPRTAQTGGSWGALLRCPLSEDVFLTAATLDAVPPVYAGLRYVRDHVATASALQDAVGTAASLLPGGKKLTYRVVARATGRQSFRRIDLQKAVEQGLTARFPSWRLVDEHARFEWWAELAGSRLWLGVRLTDARMRHRDYVQVSLPAALKPTIAHALVRLTNPSPEDVFLDPLCGSGTVVIERALAGRHAQLLAGDVDFGAVAATRTNIGPRHKPVSVQHWDARRLPLRDASVNAVASNLPFGRQIGTNASNRSLYPALLRELRRVLAPGGRLALLTTGHDLLMGAIAPLRDLEVVSQTPVLVRGVWARMYLLRRSA